MSEERCAHRWEGPPFEGDECGREERDPSHHHAGGGWMCGEEDCERYGKTVMKLWDDYPVWQVIE